MWKEDKISGIFEGRTRPREWEPLETHLASVIRGCLVTGALSQQRSLVSCVGGSEQFVTEQVHQQGGWRHLGISSEVASDAD